MPEDNNKKKGAVPVTLLSGFLGSGKTTLLKNILEQKEGLEVAVLVNDMAELNIDASLIKNENLLQSQEKVVEMQNGCICCTLREDLLVEMTKLALMRKFDAIVIESTGVSEPQQVAETFTFPIAMDEAKKELDVCETEGKCDENDTWTLNEVAKLDTCVTVVDCKAFSGDLTTCENLLERYEDISEEDDRNVCNLLIDQIEFANVILLNKTDLVTPKEAATIEKAIKILNPGAKVHKTVNSKVPMKEVMMTGRFNMEEAETSKGWLKSMTEEMKPETEEYGIGSFVYRARAPFHPQRFMDFLNSIFMVNLVEYTEAEEGEEEEEEEKEEEKDQEAGGKEEETKNGKESAKSTNDIESRTNGKDESDRKDEKEGEDGDGDMGEEEGSDEEDGDEFYESVEERNKACSDKLDLMRKKYGQIYRSKGFLWMAGRDTQFGEWSQAGAVVAISHGGLWVGILPEKMWPDDDPNFKNDCLPNRLKDRRQEIVIIGSDLKREAITEALDACLLNKEESGYKGDDEHDWKFNYKWDQDVENPVPDWPDAEKELKMALAEGEGGEHDHSHGHHHGHHHQAKRARIE